MSDSKLNQLTAQDMMETDVVTVGPDESLQTALSLITENHVTGLPVLDRKSHCVGLISATDILSYEQDHAEAAAEANDDVARYFDPEQQRWESLRVSAFALEKISGVPVAELMSRDLISVQPDASAREVAQKMLSGDVRRMLVLDDENYLMGIISAFDFVRIVADA